MLRPPGIYGPEEQRHLPRVAVCHPWTWSLHWSWGSIPRLGDAQCWEMPLPPQSHQEQSSQCVPVRPGQRWGDEAPKMQKGAHGHHSNVGPLRSGWLISCHQHKGLHAEKFSPEQARFRGYSTEALGSALRPLPALSGRQMPRHRLSVVSRGCRDKRTRRWEQSPERLAGRVGRVSCRQ